jgi:predicted RNA-binding Zn-ribbon protein involved in translation (DUF1610 family)
VTICHAGRRAGSHQLANPISPRGYNAAVRRRSFTALSILSLVMCFVTLISWPISYTTWFDAQFVLPLTTSRWCGGGTSSAEGRVFFGFLTHDLPNGASSASGGARTPVELVDGVAHTMGMFGRHWHTFGVLHQGEIPVGSDIETAWAVMLPHWFVALTLSLPPSLWLRRRIGDSRRRAPGRCTSCGYNLTANQSGVCPECGTPTKTAPAKRASTTGSQDWRASRGRTRRGRANHGRSLR